MLKVSVVRKVKVDGTWKLLPVWRVGDRLDWTRLKQNGQPVPSLTGTFYLDYAQDGKRVRKAVGDHPREAKAALASQSHVVNLRSSGMEVEDAPQIQSQRGIEGKRISEVTAAFESSPPVKLSKHTVASYRHALRNFGAWTKKTHLVQLDRTDLNDYMAYCVAAGLNVSTAIDKARAVMSVFNEHGATIKMKRGEWPRTTEKQRELYDPAALKPLFAAMDVEDYTLFQTFLMTGFRDREVGFLSWEDFDAHNSTLTVSEKFRMGFSPKNHEERTIPIPSKLVTLLQAHRKTQHGDEYLIFPTSRHNTAKGCPGGQRDRHMLDRLKRIAHHAGLNCGRCTGVFHKRAVTCRTHAVCGRFGLHMFRHTYATTLLRDGMDLVSLQKLLGHRDMQSTRIYLRALEPADLLTKLRGTSIATRFVY